MKVLSYSELQADRNRQAQARLELAIICERLTKELAEWRTLCAWGGAPEIVHGFIRGQQERIHAGQLLDEALAEAKRDSDIIDWLKLDRAELHAEMGAAK